MALGTLSKLPAILWVTPVIIHLIRNNIRNSTQIQILAATVLALTPALLWYFYWVPELVETYRYQLYFPKTITEGMSELRGHVPGLLKNFYFHAFCSYTAFACALAGSWVLIRKGTANQLLAAFAMIIVFALFIIKTGSVFPLHNYYIIPFVPVMALSAGLLLSSLPQRAALVITLAIIAESLLNQQHDFFIKENQKYKMKLEQLAADNIPANEKIVINGGQSPQLMYLAHRKGWTLNNEQILAPGALDSIASLGGKYLIIDKTGDIPAPQSCIQIFEDEHFRIFKHRSL
jgi:hypothetical protein